MAKSKVFILERDAQFQRNCHLKHLSGKPVRFFCCSDVRICHRTFKRFYGFGIEPGKKQRVKITIEPDE